MSLRAVVAKQSPNYWNVLLCDEIASSQKAKALLATTYEAVDELQKFLYE